MSKSALILASHRLNRSPNQRFRFEQYFDYLSENGIKCELSYLISADDDKFFYKKGNFIKKFFVILRSRKKRKKNIQDIRAGKYDLVYISREAFLTGSYAFERKIAATGIPVIYDFDDAIWLQNVSNANRWFKWMKNPAKTSEIIKIADIVFAGNQYLFDYAARFNNDIRIVHTTIDTDEYFAKPEKPENAKICIGWSGSITTIQHFEFAIPFLKKLKAKYGDEVYIKVIGDGTYVNEELNIKGLPWKKDTEIQDLNEIDIGIMPLPDDEWAKGKCGLKGLQYMALGIPTLMSPVGVNSEIIQDSVNGFLADEPEEWVAKISRLIEDKNLRLTMGRNGRQTVIDKYSVDAWKDKYLKYFNELIQNAPAKD